MGPATFEYRRARSVDHALDLLTEHSDAVVLAAGHSLLPGIEKGFADPDVVVDIGGIEPMRGIDYRDGHAVIGSLTRYAAIESDDELRDSTPALTAAVDEIGDAQIRNAATIGGNLVAPDPVAELPAAAIASGATLVVAGPDGERHVDADEFFAGETTALTEHELLVRIEVPKTVRGETGIYVKKQSRGARYSLVGVAARLHIEDGTVSAARVAANGLTRNGARLTAVEDALEGNVPTSDVAATAAAGVTAAVDEATAIETSHASAAYRADLLEVYTKRAIEGAAERAGTRITP